MLLSHIATGVAATLAITLIAFSYWILAALFAVAVTLKFFYLDSPGLRQAFTAWRVLEKLVEENVIITGEEE